MADLIGARILNISSLDYRVRGFTRNIRGKKLFIDHKIHSIQQFIAADVKKRYDRVDIKFS